MNKTILRTAVIFLFCTTVVAQQQQSTGATDNGVTAAFSSTYSGGYPVTGIDTVNLYNGHVSLNLPLGRIGARGTVGYQPGISISRVFQLRPYQYWSPAGGSGVWYPPKFKVISEGYMDSYDYSNFRPGLLPAVIIGRRTRDHNPTPGFTIPPSTQSCYTLTKLYLRLAGGEIELRDVGTNGEPYNDSGSVGTNRGRDWHAVDGSGMLFVSDSDIRDETCLDNGFAAMNGINMVYPTGFLMLNDGTRYRFVQGFPVWMRDRNGNTITFQGPVGAPEVTDSIGRGYQLSGGVTYKDHSGTNQTVAVINGTLDTALRSDFVAAGVKSLGTLFQGVSLESPTAIFNPIVTKTVHLPNGLEYHFFYSEYGELARIELPTGGAIEYDYEAGTSTNGTGVTASSTSPQVYRVVTARRIYDSPTHLQARQTFEYAFPYPGPVSTVTSVKTYDSASVVVRNERHTFKGMVFSDFQSTAWYQPFDNGREITNELLDVAGTNVLRRVDSTWETLDLTGAPTVLPQNAATHPTNLDCALTAVKTTFSDTNLAAKTTFTYDGYGNKTDTYDYDFGSPGSGNIGALLRRTHADFNYDAPYVQSSGAHILNLVARQWVSSDANGTNKLALTEFEYDNYATDSRHAGLVSRANISGSCVKLDDTATNCLQVSDSSYTKRGNLTQSTAYYDIPNSGVAISALQYDIAGNVVKAIDARGYATTLDYTDRFGAPDGEAQGNSGSPELSLLGQYSYAFATQATNALGHIVYTQFNYYVGKPVNTQDVNGAVTSLHYDDVLDRLTKTNLPDGGRKTNTYVDAHQCGPHVETKTLFETGRETDSLVFFDGLGRAARAFTYENQDVNSQWLTTDTQYDSLGLAARVSNPYRSTGCTSAVNPSGLWTTTVFDALGRGVSVTTPDNAVVGSAYSGNQVLVTDQSLKQRMSKTNALGQLTDVWEITAADGATEAISFPGHSEVTAGYRTRYVYNALDDLTTVTQQVGVGGSIQTRSFAYDSLKRLTSSLNPESGTVHYVYDNNGNLTSKLDARNITSTLVYDALNRNITVDYSNTTTINPDITRAYDNPATGANGKGRLWNSYAGGNDTAGSNVENKVVSSYDALGRPLVQSQVFKLNGTWSSPYQTRRTYNLAGAVATQTYPSNHTVSYTYDSAGRTGSFTGTLGDSTQRNYATAMTYSPFGGMKNEQFGTDTAIYHQLNYNVRGQLWDVRAGTGFDSNTNWNRGALQSFYDQAGSFGGSGIDNNGNVLATKHYRPLDEQGASFTISTDDYGYDALNRLTSVSEKYDATGQATVPQFVQSYLYDRNGNRRIDTNPSQTWGGVNNSGFEVEAGTNRLYSPGDLLLAEVARLMQYDAAGNLKRDTYTGAGDRSYDAENRMITAWGGNNQLQVYTYNADGQRVRRKVDGTETWQVYGIGGELLADYAQNASPSSPQKEYGYRNGQLLITAEVTPTINIRWLVADQLGTPRIIIDKTGLLANVKRHDYLPFGEELTTQGLRNTLPGYSGDNIRQKFTSKERDTETGLDYFGARYYGSTQGRFTTVDPLRASATPADPQTWNRYAYVLNRPMIAIDPDGLSVIIVVVSPRSAQGTGSASTLVMDRRGAVVAVGRHGKDPIPGLAVGNRSDRRQINADTPFGVYSIFRDARSDTDANGRHTGTQGGNASSNPRGVAFGTGIVYMRAEAGEVVANNRDTIYFHGGGTALGQNAFDPDQPLVATHGCIRLANQDVNSLIQTVNNLDTNGDPVTGIFVGDAQTLNNLATQRDANGNFMYGELRIAMGLEQPPPPPPQPPR